MRIRFRPYRLRWLLFVVRSRPPERKRTRPRTVPKLIFRRSSFVSPELVQVVFVVVSLAVFVCWFQVCALVLNW